jgi:hypothetical protein
MPLQLRLSKCAGILFQPPTFEEPIVEGPLGHELQVQQSSYNLKKVDFIYVAQKRRPNRNAVPEISPN